ncbi:serine/arginine repetitive matrix protein 2-like [Saccostrea echinata]|uniref:serine/arginine repetitive matrix protein 2-like n=1 Tax=Saccostrea echinata TaxID=191078 RepID=UPI002A821DF7|nr:serine/arginine repetitive matrix protein 2-like [Saccostrea echinata]
MSFEEEISTLFARDLDNSRENERKIIADIHKLADENRALRRSLSLLQQNATLRTAKLITELVIWVDSMVETFQCSVTIPESTKNVGTHQEKSAFRPISPAIDGQNVTVPEIIVTSASQNLAQALSPVPEFFKPKIIIPESERLKSPYDLSQRGTISKGDFYSQHSVISPATNRLEVKQGFSRPRSPGIYKSKISEQKKPAVVFSGNRTGATQKTTPLIQSNFSEYQDVRLDESDSGSTGRDVAFYREPFEEDRSKYYQKYPQRTVQSNYPSSLDDTRGITQSTIRSGYDKVTQKTNQDNLNVPTIERRTVSEDPDLETNRHRETTRMVRRGEIVSNTTQSHPSSSSQQSYHVSRNRDGYDQRSRSPIPEQRIRESYDPRNERSVLEERNREGYDQRSRSPIPQQRYVKEPTQDVPRDRESHYQRTKSPMPDQTPRVIYDERSKSLLPEQRTGEGYDQRSKSPMPTQRSREIYDRRSKSPMPEQGSREIYDRRSKSPIPEQSPRERYDQRSRRYMPEQRTREIYDERSKSTVPQQMYVSEPEQNIPVNWESFDQSSKTPMPEQRTSVSYDQRSRSLTTERRYATQPEQEVPKSMEMYDQRNRSPMPEQRAREGYDQGSRSHMPEQRGKEGFDQGSRSPMPEQRTREGFDQECRSRMSEQRARENFDQGSRHPMPEQRTREGFDQESRSLMPKQRVREGFDQGSRIPKPDQSAREGYDEGSRSPMPEQRVKEGFDQGSRIPMQGQRAREGFDQGSRIPMPEQSAREGYDEGSKSPMPEERARERFDQGSRRPMPEQRTREGFDQERRSPMPEQRAKEGFDQGSRIPMQGQRTREGFDQGSRIPMPEQSAREGYDQGSRSPMPEQRARERFDQESRIPMPEQRGRENYDQRRSLTPKQGSVKEATWNEQDVPRKRENREQRIYTPQQKYIPETKTEQNILKNQEKYGKRNRDSISEKTVVAETNNLSKSPVQDRSRGSGAELEEWESMDHMISSGQQRKQVYDNSDAVVPQQDSSSEKSRSMYSKSYQRSTGEDHTGRDVVGDPTGRDVVGDPIATSTPKTQRGVGEPIATSTPKTREEKLADSIMNKAKPLVSRPIDQLIGIDPKMTQERWLKAAMIRKNKRLIGEIAFQMDRRILEYVFAWDSGSKDAKKRRYYGFSIANIGAMIQKEAVQADGSKDARKELEMRKRFENLVRTLAKLGYNLDQHGEFSQDMVNKYGLLSGPPSRKMVTELGLEDPVVLRVLFSQLIVDEKELNNVLVLLDCLCLLAYEDRRPLFMW